MIILYMLITVSEKNMIIVK